MPQTHITDHWMIVGEQSMNSFLVRGGLSPAVIKVSTPDSSVLQLLVECANAGIDAARALRAKNNVAHVDMAPPKITG